MMALSTYKLMVLAIKNYKAGKGTDTYDSLCEKMDTFLVANRLTIDEYNELMAMLGDKE